MITLGSNGSELPPPDAKLFATLLAQVSDPKAAAARLAELQQCIALAGKALDDARAVIVDADTRTTTVVKREAAVSDREAAADAKERELKQRENDMEFRERHVADLSRKAEADNRAAASLRAELEQRLDRIKRAAAA